MRAHIFVRQRARYCIAYTGRILGLFLVLLSPGILLAKEIQYPAISIQLKQVPLSAALLKLQEASHYGVLFHADDVTKYGKPVTISVKKQPLPKVLDLLFEHQPFTYHITDSYITVAYKSPEPIIPKSETNKVGDTSSITITGHISSEKGEPLAGATVMVKGTQIGAITDQKGAFTLRDVPESPTTTLHVQIIGFTSKDITLNGLRRLNITLKEALNSLDEVVALGYGSTTKRNNTGAINKISSSEIATQPIGNVLTALEGRLPGIYVKQNSGVAGGSISLVLRGKGSISGSSDPLYLIDGVPFTSTSIGSTAFSSSILNGGNPLNAINPADIDNIQILKDADATSIYGSRGANGVVLITTKKGRPGKTTVGISAYTGISQVTKRLPLLNTNQYRLMRKEAFANDGVQPTTANAPELLVWDSTKNTDWQKTLLGGTAHINDIQGSLSGGNSYTQFRIASSYHKETTVFPGDFADERGTTNLNLTHLSEDEKFKASISSTYSAEVNNIFFNNITVSALTLPPNVPNLVDSLGNPIFPPQFRSAGNNPFALFKRKFKSVNNTLLTSAQLSYRLLPFLSLNLSGGFTRMTMDETYLLPFSSLNPATATIANTSATFGNGSLQTWTIEPQLSFIYPIGKGTIDGVLGSTFQQDINQNRTIQGTGYSNDGLMESLAGAGSISVKSDLYTKYKYNGLFGRINYIYQNRYILNLTGRRDGSSRFGPGHQFGNFGSIGGAWIFSDEEFFKNKALSYGKLRASYGTTGNDRIGDYQYISNWGPTSYPYNGVSGLLVSNIGIPDYSWESTRKIEVGLSLGFWGNRLLLNGDYYRNRSSNQLLLYTIPSSTGFQSIISNFPALIQNKGFEFDLSSINIHKGNWQWTTTFNATIPNNKIIDFPGLDNSTYANSLEIGKSVSITRLYHSAGIDQNSGLYVFQSSKGGTTSTPETPTDYLDDVDLLPRLYGGLGNNLRYKNWRLDIFFQFAQQKGKRYVTSAQPGTTLNQPVWVLNRWQHAGNETPYQKFSNSPDANQAYGYYTTSNAIYEDASFIRLKNVQISYELSKNLLKKAHLQQCMFFVRSQNLLTITSFSGLDPEVNGDFSNQQLPPLRTIAVGLQLSL